MFKLAFALFALIACTAAEASLQVAPIAVRIVRKYNGIAAAPIIAAAPVAAPLVARYAATAALPTPLAAPHYVAPFAAASLFW